MSSPLAVLLGGASSYNIHRLVDNFGWMLSDDYDLHLVTTVPDAFDEEELVGFPSAELTGSTRFGAKSPHSKGTCRKMILLPYFS